MVTKNVYVVFFLNLVKHLCTGKATNAVTNKWRKNTNFCSAFFTKTDCFQCVYALHDQFVPTKNPKNKPTKEWNLGVFFIYFYLFFYLFFCDTVYKGLKSAHREMSVFKLSVSLCCADDLMADQRMDISSTMTDFMSPSSTDLISSSISTPGMDYTRKRKGSTTDYQ